MRYKIKSRNAENFAAVQQLVKGTVQVYVESKKRLTMSTDELPKNIRSQVEDSGATVIAEEQYDLDSQI